MGKLAHASIGDWCHQEDWESDGSHTLAGYSNQNIVRAATYVIAASNSSNSWKACADAVCDGTTDRDTIQDVIDALPAGGGKILLADGTFTIADYVTAPDGNYIGLQLVDNMELCGMGWASIIKAGDGLQLGDSGALIANEDYSTAGKNNVIVRNLQLDGNKTNRTIEKSSLLYGDGATADHGANWLIENIYAHDSTGNAINLRYVDWSHIINCYCPDNGLATVGTPSGVYLVRVDYCDVISVHITGGLWRGVKVNLSSHIYLGGVKVYACADSGINITDCDEVDLDHCHSWGNAVHGLLVSADDTTMTNLRVTGGSYSGNGTTTSHYGMAFEGSGFTINGAKISSNTGNGVYGAGFTDSKIVNCDINSNAVDGIRLDGTFGDLIIQSNKMETNAGRGIRILATPTTAIAITDNDLSGNTTLPYSYSGTATVLIKLKNNTGYITAGEVRTASGVLTAGDANAIAFAWHNPEGQDIHIRKVVVQITTGSVTANSVIDVGIADDAAGTNRGVEFFDDLDANDVDINDSWVAGDGGTQTKWVTCQDSASATDGWVVGQILVANAAALVGSYYIEYVGK
jgi:hypothetical protein